MKSLIRNFNTKFYYLTSLKNTNDYRIVRKMDALLEDILLPIFVVLAGDDIHGR